MDFHGLGINAKISELQSAMGLAVFDHIDEIFEERKKIVEYYDINLNLNKLQRLKIRKTLFGTIAIILSFLIPKIHSLKFKKN